jgi:general secretion pathway protein F
MPDFQYTARETSGQQTTGVLTASSKQDALNALASQSLFPIRIDLAESTKSEQKFVSKRVSPRHLCVFYTQLADLLRSGVPLLRSLDLLSKQSVNQTLKLVLQDVRGQVADGTHLADSMRPHPKVFTELAVSMIRAGEEGSFMEDVLKRIAIFTEHQQELKNKVVGAMVYPLFLLVMGGLIVSGMLIFFVPKFEPIFERMGERGELPWATTALLSFSHFAQHYWIVGFGGMALGIFLLVQWIKTPEGHLQADKFRLKAPGLGPIVRSLAVARFCRILGTLLRNGVPILQSLRIAKDATGNIVLSEAISTAAENISEGKSLARPLEASGQFPEEVVEMISVGEEANNLEQVLIDVADNMERRTNRLLEMFVRLLEPALLSVMAGIILFVVIALLLPIMQTSTAL